MWKPNNIFDWILVFNIPVQLVFIVLLKVSGSEKEVGLQFLLALGITSYAWYASKKHERKKEFERLQKSVLEVKK